MAALAILLCFGCSKNSSSTDPGLVSNTGTGGSLAKFTIVGDYMYAVDGSNSSYLYAFNISDSSKITFVSKTYIGFGIETIFPYNNKLFIASNTGMFIYQLNNPAQPVQENYVNHFNGCDPVVVSGNYAYLTIHGGTRCNGSTINQLQVYDVSSLYYPQLVHTVNLDNPFGLAVHNNYLFVCDNGTGIRTFDISNPMIPQQLSITTGENFVDLIPIDSILVCMLTDGVSFYDMKQPENLIHLKTVQ